MKIRENYVPRAAQKAANKQQTAACRICGQQIPLAEMDDHIRSMSHTLLSSHLLDIH
jgi:splicing factor 3A subunit 1